jgi:hypothetical protein
MNKILAFIFLFVVVNLAAQNNAKKDTTAQPAITAKIKEMKIGAAGGSISSSDGKAVLIIPAGAVSKKTNFSIQPITNLMPNGNGAAYRLEPSGIQFQKPVQLIFNYDEDEAKDSMQLLLGISMQDDKGQWYSLQNFTLDTVAKTLSGNIKHFSDWGKFDKIKISPVYKKLKVKKSLNLDITLIIIPDVTYLGDELMPLTFTKTRKIPWKATWAANDIVNGSATEGKIVITSKSSIKYTAPATEPPKNPVAVTAELTGIVYRTRINGVVTTFEKLILESNILIYDNAYEVKMISEIIDPGMGTSLGSVTYKDTGSFVVSLKGKEAKIIEKVNKNTSAALNYSGGCCYDYKILKLGHGNIHIAGTAVIKVTPPVAPEKSAMIEIAFRRNPAKLPIFQVTCKCIGDKKPHNFTNEKGIIMMQGLLPAFPQVIDFEAKEEEQTILQHGKPGEDLYTKITVKKIKEE